MRIRDHDFFFNLCSPYPTDAIPCFAQDWPSRFSEKAENDQKFMINLQS